MFFILALLACPGDIGIIKVYDNPNITAQDTQQKTTATDTESSEEATIAEDEEEVIEPASEPAQEITQVSGFVNYHFKQIACPACVGVTSEFDIKVEARFHFPTSGNYFDAYDYVGDCTTAIYDVQVNTQPLTDINEVSLDGVQNIIDLYPAGAGLWVRNGLYEYQYERQTSYNVYGDYFYVQDAFKTVEGFDYIEPYTLLWVDPSYAYDAPIYRTGATFTWAPVLSDTIFEVIVAVYSYDGSQFLGAVSCLSNDTGTLTVPGQYLQYPQGSITAVHLIRHRMQEIVVNELNGKIQSHMKWEVIGTGHIE